MKTYLISFAVGALVGVIYGLLGVRSPAPPVVALLGLAGMLAGEQCVALVQQHLARDSGIATVWTRPRDTASAPRDRT